jgi:serine protease Do
MRARLVVLASALVGCSGAASTPSPAQSSAAGGSLTDASPQRAVASSDASVDASRRTAITRAVELVAPAVVTVQTEVVERVPADPFEAFFGGQSGQRVGAGIGSGFITRSDGVIVTNAHVVSGATRVSVAMRDGTTVPARVLGVDETNDLAVLKIDGRDLPVAPLGNSRSLLVGEWAIAIGNPYGFVLGNTEPSVTAGVISAVGRNLVGRGEGNGVYVDMIQTDASINPGNSGGPLVNAAGEVIGVNSSIYSPSGGSIGLGFAIPINRARRVAEDLLQRGAVRSPWIGIQLRPAEAANGRENLLAGAVVSGVAPGSPAARAGIQAGDVLVRSRDRVLRNHYDWEAEQLDLRVGETVPLRVRRGGSESTVTVTVADRPEVSAPKVAVLREIELTTVTAPIRAERGIQSPRGALVYRVSQRVANEIGVQAGDVIIQVNRVPVASAEDVARAIDHYGGRGPIRLYVERRRQLFTTDFVVR